MSEPRAERAPRPPFKGARVLNPHAELTAGGGALCLSCDFDGARYHVWLNPETLELEDQTLYKNPPAGLTEVDEGYFRTCRLRPTSKRAEWLIFAMKRALRQRGLLEQARKAQREQQAAEAAERAVARAQARKAAAADELYTLLCAFVERGLADRALERKARALLDRIERDAE